MTKEEFALIEQTGIANLASEQLQSAVKKYFKFKADITGCLDENYIVILLVEDVCP